MRVLVAAGASLIVAACGSGGHATRPTIVATTPSAPLPTATTPVAAPKPRPKPKPKPNPGRLPQTHALPSAGTPGFHREMTALWNGVRRDSLHTALRAYFPEAAYVQVKGIGDPAGDWNARLVRDYGLDLSAAHGLLGTHPERARLVRVIVPTAYVHWVDPGACYNRVGYYEVPNSRLVYREGNQVSSFGIASMISWRGVWYVVHLGSIVGPSGVVNDPSAGEGSSAPSSTC